MVSDVMAWPRRIGFALITFCFLALALASNVPFSGSSAGMYAFTSGTTATVDSFGKSTIMGPFQSHEDLTLSSTGAVVGTITWTSADGSTIVADVAGAFTSPTTVSGTYLVTGGTGRFEGAAGSASFTATLLGPDTVSASFSGQLTAH